MESGNPALAAWSYGLAGAAYTAFALYLLRIGTGARRGQHAARLLLAAVRRVGVVGLVRPGGPVRDDRAVHPPGRVGRPAGLCLLVCLLACCCCGRHAGQSPAPGRGLEMGCGGCGAGRPVAASAGGAADRRPRRALAQRAARLDGAAGACAGAGGAAVPQRAGGFAVERQAAVPGPGAARSCSICTCSRIRCCSTASIPTPSASAARCMR